MPGPKALTKDQKDSARKEALRQVLYEVTRRGNPQQRRKAQEDLKKLR